MAGIVLDRIDKAFGETRVLKGVSLGFDAGAFVSLVRSEERRVGV